MAKRWKRVSDEEGRKLFAHTILISGRGDTPQAAADAVTANIAAADLSEYTRTGKMGPDDLHDGRWVCHVIFAESDWWERNKNKEVRES